MRVRTVLDRYVTVGLAALLVFVSVVATAYGYFHTTNNVAHGLLNDTPTSFASGSPHWATAEVRHYFTDGTYNVQCEDAGYAYAECTGNWGTAPCQKRAVNGVEFTLSRHWSRRSGCSGTIHP